MEGNVKYQRCYNVKGSGTKNKVARNETLPFGSGKPAEQFSETPRKRQFHFPGQNELVATTATRAKPWALEWVEGHLSCYISDLMQTLYSKSTAEAAGQGAAGRRTC